MAGGAGGTKRLPRAVREQQMLDAAVKMFSANGYHETSMDAIAAQASDLKPMLYLYYGSKEELFGACLGRELGRFIDSVRSDIDLKLSPRELLRRTIVSVLQYIDANRASWIVLYTQATSSQAFAHGAEGRRRSSTWSPDCWRPAPGNPAAQRLPHDGRRVGRGRRSGGRQVNVGDADVDRLPNCSSTCSGGV